MSEQAMKAPRIWAVGGGKGGVGKSVIVTNLAIALSRQGQRCAILDADLGGANLHTLLGMTTPEITLSSFFSRQVPSLRDTLISTPYKNLWLISGARAQLDMANPQHALKEKLLRQLQTLDVDFLLLDLGAGSNFTTLDFFLAAHRQIVVVNPTPTSVENAYHFLKAAYFRKLRRAIRQAKANSMVDQLVEDRVLGGLGSPRELLIDLLQRDPAMAAPIKAELQQFVPHLIVNQTRRDEETVLGTQMASACKDFFGTRCEYLGSVWNDDRVYYAIQKKRPVLDAYPQSPFALAMEQFTRILIKDRERSYDRSIDRGLPTP
jgi:flagellar biosynthesis protein FlhG